MNRFAAATVVSAALVASLAFAPAATASNVAWNVSIGGPAFAVSAGQPGIWGGGFRPVGPGCVGCGWRRPWVRPVVAAPIFAPPTVFVQTPVFAPIVAPFPVVAPVVVVRPRRVFVRAPVVTRPVVVARAYWPR